MYIGGITYNRIKRLNANVCHYGFSQQTILLVSTMHPGVMLRDPQYSMDIIMSLDVNVQITLTIYTSVIIFYLFILYLQRIIKYIIAD